MFKLVLFWYQVWGNRPNEFWKVRLKNVCLHLTTRDQTTMFSFRILKNLISVKTNWKLFESSNHCNLKSGVFHGKGESSISHVREEGSNSRFYCYFKQLVCWPFSDCKRQSHDGLCPNLKLANNFRLQIKNNNFHLKYP